MANDVLAVISLVWNWGKPRGHCGANPADGLPKVRQPRNAPIVNRAWAGGEYNAVVAAASPQLRLAVVIGACTGLREGDVIRLPWSA